MNIDEIINNVHVNGICLEWDGYVAKNGYGVVYINGKHGNAHRFFYELYKGEIPKGYDIDHICRNRACVDPEHLEAVTRKENIRRGRGAGGVMSKPKEKCKNGHDLTIVKLTGGKGCDICKKISEARNRKGIRLSDIECKNGHKRTPQNTGYNTNHMTGKTNKYCKDCIKIRLKIDHSDY